jgi:tellurite resistance protein TerC
MRAMSELPSELLTPGLTSMLDSFLMAPLMGQPAWLWLGFALIVTLLLALDLGVLHREDRAMGVRESLLLSAGYISMGLAFGAAVWWQLGEGPAIEYYTGFLIEKSLSMDNVFVIALIFSVLGVPAQYQHRVLFWGIVGVVLLRGLMIGVGAALLHEFAWILYGFGALLILTGIQMWRTMDQTPDIAGHPLLRWLRRHLRVTPELHGNAFLVQQPHPQTGRPVTWVTPLFLALCMVEAADLVFAIDSVPAIFAITSDPYIVYTSNIFAILGLRALYFALAAMVHRFKYLKPALALVLVFIGSKIFLVGIVGKFPAWLSLGVTFGLVAGGVFYSMWKTRSEVTAPPPEPQPGVARSQPAG